MSPAKSLSRAEHRANANPQIAHYQSLFYGALLRGGYPHIVVERYQSGHFASNDACEIFYRRALDLVAPAGAAYPSQGAPAPAGAASNPASAVPPPPHPSLQTVGQAVAVRGAGGGVGRPRAGDGSKSAPLYVVVEESRGNAIFKWVRWFFTFAIFGYVSLTLMGVLLDLMVGIKKSGVTNPFGSRASEVRAERQTTRFSDVHGCDEAKEELQEVVEFLKNPSRYNTLGGRLPKGVLLVGPPGTGKTLLARAVAGEAGVPYFYMSGSEFDEVYVGVGAKRVRELFNAARAKAPAIVFIDELDAIGGKRNKRDASLNRQTLNQLLNELDGFDQGTGVIFIAATNHPKILDKALLRPGRFDRQVAVDLPDMRGRLAILKHHTRNIRLAPEVDLAIVAQGTPGFSGAQLENLANTAAIQGSKTRSQAVSAQNLEWAKDRVMMGAERKSRVISLKDRLQTAYHESGHTLVCLYMNGSRTLDKATILPRANSNGSTWFVHEEKTHENRAEYEADIAVGLGGKIAEELVYGDALTGTGAAQDISMATKRAFAMVTRLGFSDDLGDVDYWSFYKTLSPQTRQQIDDEVRRLMNEGRRAARRLLEEHRQELDLLAQALVQYETLNRDEVLRVISGEKLPNRIIAVPDTAIHIPEVKMARSLRPSPETKGSSGSAPSGTAAQS